MSATYTSTPTLTRTLDRPQAVSAAATPSRHAAASAPPKRAQLARVQRGPRAAALALAVSVTLAMLVGIDLMASVDLDASHWARTPSSQRA